MIPTPEASADRNRSLVMQGQNRLTVAEAIAVLNVLEPVRNVSPSVSIAFRKIEHCMQFARSRERGKFAPSQTGHSPPPATLKAWKASRRPKSFKFPTPPPPPRPPLEDWEGRS